MQLGAVLEEQNLPGEVQLEMALKLEWQQGGVQHKMESQSSGVRLEAGMEWRSSLEEYSCQL